MLKIVVSLKEGIASEKLDQDTANAPDVTGKTPAKIKNNLWRSVMAC